MTGLRQEAVRGEYRKYPMHHDSPPAEILTL